MRGYGNLDYFQGLDFMESLNCYICLVQDFENELTLDKLTLILKTAFSKDYESHNEVDDIVDEFF